MANILLDICLSDLPKENIKTAQNGKKYIKLVVAERKEADERGNDHFIKVYIPKEQRKEGDKPIYVGSGKASKPKEQTAYGAPVQNAPQTTAPQNNADEEDDLPF